MVDNDIRRWRLGLAMCLQLLSRSVAGQEEEERGTAGIRDGCILHVTALLCQAVSSLSAPFPVCKVGVMGQSLLLSAAGELKLGCQCTGPQYRQNRQEQGMIRQTKAPNFTLWATEHCSGSTNH